MSRPSRRAEERGKTGKTRRRRVRGSRAQCKGWSEVYHYELNVHVHVDQLEGVLLLPVFVSADAAGLPARRSTDRHATRRQPPQAASHTNTQTTESHQSRKYINTYSPRTPFSHFPLGFPGILQNENNLGKLLLLARYEQQFNLHSLCKNMILRRFHWQFDLEASIPTQQTVAWNQPVAS